jgi:hypothetical protein
MRLWIDDERSTPAEYTHTAASSSDAIALLIQATADQAPIELISFDHDLGYPQEDGSSLLDNSIPGDTSRPVLLWMIEHDIWPAEIRLHTANPVGRDWLAGMIGRYAPKNTRLPANVRRTGRY